MREAIVVDRRELSDRLYHVNVMLVLTSFRQAPERSSQCTHNRRLWHGVRFLVLVSWAGESDMFRVVPSASVCRLQPGFPGRLRRALRPSWASSLAEVTQHIPNKGEHQIRFYG